MKSTFYRILGKAIKYLPLWGGITFCLFLWQKERIITLLKISLGTLLGVVIVLICIAICKALGNKIYKKGTIK